jgi:hypothetical protein
MYGTKAMKQFKNVSSAYLGYFDKESFIKEQKCEEY